MRIAALTYPHELDEDTLVEYGAQLEPADASVAALPGTGYTVTVWVDSDDPVTAMELARGAARKVATGEPTMVSVYSEDEYAKVADSPTLPEVVSAPEVGQILGVSRQRVHQLQDTAVFPEPLYRLRTGPIWSKAAVEHFDRTWSRRPGRPAGPVAGKMTNAHRVPPRPRGDGSVRRQGLEPRTR